MPSQAGRQPASSAATIAAVQAKTSQPVKPSEIDASQA